MGQGLSQEALILQKVQGSERIRSALLKSGRQWRWKDRQVGTVFLLPQQHETLMISKLYYLSICIEYMPHVFF
jgi:hypothetical protein